jgi:2-polyprenyl-6-methoxyphenol hydroxylase-like FAD-dependent oxidoreductase
MTLRVLIAGGGIGGLCLAQGLRKEGVAAKVFERDASAEVRGQGFRFRVDSDGDAALAACLPANLYELYRATSSKPVDPPSAAYDFQMREIFRMPSRGNGASHMSVNRRTLREVLMGGLYDSIHFGHVLTRVEQDDTGVTAFFADGAAVKGDVLVAADGIGSIVRKQMLPNAGPMDTGARCIYGTTPLSDRLLEAVPAIFSAGFVPFAGPEGRTLAMGMFRVRKPMTEAAQELAPDTRLTPVGDYLMWLYVAPRDAFAMTDDELRAADCAALHRKALELMEGWHPSLRLVVEQADVPALFQLAIRTSLAVAPWPATRVTLLGDAIHAMTPAGGIGANTAMRDAALLAKLLGEAARGVRDLLEAIARYETEMRAYGFAAARQSMEGAARLYRIPMPQEVTQ